MLIIRLARRGRKKQAFFDLVVAEKSCAATKKFLSKLGYYNPLSENGVGQFVFEKDLVEKYLENGAQISQSAARLLSKNGCVPAGKFVKARKSHPKKESEKTEAKV